MNHLNPSTGSSSPFAPMSGGRQKAKGRCEAGKRHNAGRRDWKKSAPRVTPSDWVLVFDCETRTTPDQRLRFGAYQLRYKGEVSERGAFYEPEVLAPGELAILQRVVADEQADSDGEPIRLLTRTGFVEEVFYGSGYAVGARIVGFNLPFDLSRLARRSMRGGFSLARSRRIDLLWL